MSSVTSDEVRRHLSGLALANEFEIQELRNASVELKLRQLWTLMRSTDLFDDMGAREIGAQQVRERWLRLYSPRSG